MERSRNSHSLFNSCLLSRKCTQSINIIKLYQFSYRYSSQPRIGVADKRRYQRDDNSERSMHRRAVCTNAIGNGGTVRINEWGIEGKGGVTEEEGGRGTARGDGVTWPWRLAPHSRFCYAQIFDSVIRAAACAALIKCIAGGARWRHERWALLTLSLLIIVVWGYSRRLTISRRQRHTSHLQLATGRNLRKFPVF